MISATNTLATATVAGDVFYAVYSQALYLGPAADMRVLRWQLEE
jgi:hypothetical protein